MYYYARSDTHYLLYVYDMVRNELVEQSNDGNNKVEWVLQKSKEVSLQRYETPLCDEDTGQGSRGWFNVLVKSPSGFNNEQFAVYKAIYKWRDDLARRYDESPAFIMPQHVLGDIARLMPSDAMALVSILQKDGATVKAHLAELLQVISEAKASGTTGPSMLEFFRGDSLGTVARKVFSTTKSPTSDPDIPAAKELRSEHSQLWGGMSLSSVWDGTRQVSNPSGTTQISLPWTAYIQNQGNMDVDLTDEVPVEAEAEVVMIPVGTESRQVAAKDEDFTLKAGRTQNGKSTESSESDSDSGDDDDQASKKKAANEAMKAERAAKKAARKEAKKAAKREARQSAKSDATGEDDEDDEQAFDYNKAQSVLHAQRSNGSTEQRKKSHFDPYGTKGWDELKGARNMNYQKPGKTATFKK
jgi:exosome complex exonuclease RRP6